MTIDETISKYKSEEYDYFGTNSNSTVVGDLTRYHHKLWKARLDKLGLPLTYASLRDSEYKADKVTTDNSRTFAVRCDSTDDYVEIGYLRIRLSKCVCYTMTSPNRNEDNSYACPHCGAIPSIGGCNHCKTVLRECDMGPRVISAFRYKRRIKFTVDRTFIKATISLIVFMLVWALGLYLHAIILGYFCWKGLVFKQTKTEAQNLLEVRKMENNTNGFMHLESLLYNIETKVKAVHYANDPSEVSSFAVFAKLTDLIRSMTNCAYVRMDAINLNEYHSPSEMLEPLGYEQVCVSVRMTVYIVQEGTGEILTLKEKGRLVAIRFKDSPKNCTDATLYRCPKCGGHVSLDSTMCPKCGEKFELQMNDWLITDYDTTVK